MRIHSISIKNFGPFKELRETHLGSLATIVGKNDVGKSSILRAIKLFFEDRPKIELEDVHDGADPDEDVVIEIAFSHLPETIQIEKGVDTTFKEEMLLDKNENLLIRKTYPRDNLTKVKISLITMDFQDDVFAGLTVLNETALNERCEREGIEVTRAGRGITNKSKREALREKAREKRIPIGRYVLDVPARSDLWRYIKSVLPNFELFESETRTDIRDTSFQSPFRTVVKMAAENRSVAEARSAFTGEIKNAIQDEIDAIFERLERYTSDIVSLRAEPVFSWDKAVSIKVYGEDHSGIIKPLEKRGSGIRRLLMVAFFQYLAEKQRGNESKFIFGVEEPENNLHPSLQRDLAYSFRIITIRGSSANCTRKRHGNIDSISRA